MYFQQHGTGMPLSYMLSVGRTIVNIVFAPFLLAQISAFRRYFANKTKCKHLEVPKKYTAAILVMMAGVILINHFFTVMAVGHIEDAIIQLIIIQLSSLAIIFLIIWVYNTILNHLESLEENRLKGLSSKRWEVQYKEVVNSQRTISKMNHDLQQHFIALSSLAADDKMPEIKNYLGEKLGEFDKVINTGNLPIDTTLNYYNQRLKEILDIALKADISIPPNLKLDAETTAITLGNALENAMEACEHVAPHQRYINVDISLKKTKLNGNLFIMITNPYVIEPIEDINGDLITTKSENYNHGMGLSGSIERLNDEIGSVYFEYSDNVFKFMMICYNVIEKNNTNFSEKHPDYNEKVPVYNE